MLSHHIEQLNSNPTWAAAYRASLAEGESVHGTNTRDALDYAVAVADLAAAKAAKLSAVEPSSPDAYTRERVAEGWRKAFGTNSRTSPTSQGDDQGVKQFTQDDAVKAGWSKAFSRLW